MNLKKIGSPDLVSKTGLAQLLILAALLVGMVGGASASETYVIDSQSYTGSNHPEVGNVITPKQDIILEQAEVMPETAGTTIKVMRNSDGTIMASDSATSDEIADFNVELKGGTKYIVYTTSTPYGYGIKNLPQSYNLLDVNYACEDIQSSGGCASTTTGLNYAIHSLSVRIPNKKPQFNSTSHNQCLIGESCDYGAEVYDSDGSIQYTNLTLEYGGSTVVSDAQRTGTTPSWNNIYTPQTGNKWLNATFETVDDAGAVTTKQINRYLSDDAPSVTINDPGNQSYFKYGVPLSVSVSDSDSEPGESWSCSVDKDGFQVDSFNLVEGTNSSYSSTVSSDLGSHSVDVSCMDGSGNTGSDSKSYSVDAAQIQDVYSPSPVYETENRSFELDLKTGAMVNQVDFSLSYGGAVRDTKSMQSSGVETLRPNLYHEIPLVNGNQTTKNWRINYNLNISNYQASTYSTIQRSTSQQSQEVLWSYYIENADTVPSNGKYIETENLKHEVEIGTETKKAELSGTTQYSRNSETDQMTVTDNTTSSTTLQGNINVGLADNFNKSTFQTSSDIQIRFNGQTRTLSTAQDNVEVYRIQLFGKANPGSLTTSKALTFDVKYEETGAEVNTRLTMDLSVWKNRDEKIRRFKFQKSPASKHSFHIYPSWASYKIRTLPYPEQTKFDLIQYWNDDKNYVRRSYFFPITQTINNQTTKIPLRTINRSESSRIDFEILNSEGSPASNVYCRVDRKFGGGSFSTVFMIKTGSQGRGQSFAEVNEIYYSFTCYKNGEVIETFPSQIMQNPMVLTLGQQQVQTVLDYDNVFDANCRYNETQISCDYQSQSEKMSEAQLTVERLEPVQNVQVCSKTSSTITGELACNQLNTTKNDYRYTVEGVYPGATITGAAGQTGVDNSGTGAGGLILTIFIFLFVFAATSFNVPLGIAAGTFSLLITETVGLWVLTPTMRASLIAVALIAGLVARR